MPSTCSHRLLALETAVGRNAYFDLEIPERGHRISAVIDGSGRDRLVLFAHALWRLSYPAVPSVSYKEGPAEAGHSSPYKQRKPTVSPRPLSIGLLPGSPTPASDKPHAFKSLLGQPGFW
jgi:hypothetical protein